MKAAAELKNISLDYQTHKPEIVLSIDANAEDLEKLTGKKLSVELKQYREHRSLEANAYHWTLCTQIARALDVSVAFVHNKLLRQCRYFETIGGQTVCVSLPDTEEVENEVLEAETYHLARSSQTKVGKDGQVYRTYVMLRGSHDFDTQEMSHLIDRTIAEAKELGIETLTENQKREMMELYGKKHNAEHGH